MYNFALPKQKDPYDFTIGAGIDPPTKAVKTLNLTGALSKTSPQIPQKQPLQAIQKSVPIDKKAKLSNNQTSAKAQQNKGPKSKFGEDIIPKRFGLKYNPPTLIMEYLVPNTGKLYHHKMKLMKLQKDTKTIDAIEYLKRKNSTYLTGENDEQIQKLIEKLKHNLNKNSKKKEEEDPYYEWKAKHAGSIATSQINKKNEFDKYKDDSYDDDDEYAQNQEEDDYDDDEDEVDYNNYNLNKLSNDELKKHKDKMEKTFKKNNLKPGEKGFVYDKQENFDPKHNCEWDDEEDDDY